MNVITITPQMVILGKVLVSGKKTLLVLTPIDRIGDSLEVLKKEFELLYLPDACLDDLHSQNLETAWGVFTNPNRSKIHFNEHFFNLVPN